MNRAGDGKSRAGDGKSRAGDGKSRAGDGRSRAGFTLLELLVAIAVFGLLLVGLTEGARFGLGVAGRQAAMSGGRGELDAVDRTLRRVVAEADPGSPFRGTGGTLALTSTLPEGAGLGGAEADIGVGLDGRHRLLLRWTPHQAGRPLRPPPPPREVELLGGVQGVTWSYWPAGGSGGWRSAWTDALPPALIRLRLEFPPDDARRWPDIVVAPMRERMAGSAPPAPQTTRP